MAQGEPRIVCQTSPKRAIGRLRKVGARRAPQAAQRGRGASGFGRQLKPASCRADGTFCSLLPPWLSCRAPRPWACPRRNRAARPRERFGGTPPRVPSALARRARPSRPDLHGRLPLEAAIQKVSICRSQPETRLSALFAALPPRSGPPPRGPTLAARAPGTSKPPSGPAQVPLAGSVSPLSPRAACRGTPRCNPTRSPRFRGRHDGRVQTGAASQRTLERCLRPMCPQSA